MMEKRSLHRHHNDEAMDDMPDTIDLKKLIHRILRKWHWFLASLLLAGGVAWLYNRLADPVYLVNSQLLTEKVVSGRGHPLSIGSGISGNAFGGFAVMSDGREYTINQMAILRSRPLIEKTLSELDFDISSFSRGRVNEVECYGDLPFKVVWDRQHPQVMDTPFEITLNPGGGFRVKASADAATVFNYAENRKIGEVTAFSIDVQVMPAETIADSNYSFSLLPGENSGLKNNASYRIVFNSPGQLADTYQKKLMVSLFERESSVIVLSVRDRNADKGIAFLNKLTETYLADNLSKKNEIANRTIDFIEQQLKAVSDSLYLSGSRKQAFQSSRQLINLSYQTEQLLQQAKELDDQRRTLETSERYYSYLFDYMHSEQEPDNIIAPSSMGVDDQLLSALILQYNKLLIEKSGLINVRNTEHFKLKQISAQLESIKKSMIENTSSMIRRSELAIADINQQIGQMELRLRGLPATEREFINIERRYNIDSETYTFLLQKLSEAQIAKASNIPDSQILEEARRGIVVEPRKTRNYLFALIMALVCPTILLTVSSLASKKIRSIDDIETISGFPLIGRIFMEDDQEESGLLTPDNRENNLTENFRGLRTKINLLTSESNPPVVAVSSAMTGEGKTYTAAHIANSFALIRKKTVLLDLDLHQTGMSRKVKPDITPGVVDYIRGIAGIRDITRSTKHPCLDVIHAGGPAPDAGELLMDGKVRELINRLKETYDMIIIDTAAAGRVSDLFQIGALPDLVLFVVRHNFTEKKKLNNTLAEIMLHRLKRVAFVVNGLNPNGAGDYDAGNSRDVVPLWE